MNELGFIEALEINPYKKISKPIIAPIAIPPNFFAPFVYITISNNNISKTDANICYFNNNIIRIISIIRSISTKIVTVIFMTEKIDILANKASINSALIDYKKRQRESMEFESFDKVEPVIRINEEINSYSINNISRTIKKIK